MPHRKSDVLAPITTTMAIILFILSCPTSGSCAKLSSKPSCLPVALSIFALSRISLHTLHREHWY